MSETTTPSASSNRGGGCLLVLIVIGLLIYWGVRAVDTGGLFSHTVDSEITAKESWMVGESKDCSSTPLDADSASYQGKPKGYAFSSINCDDGPSHQIKITFYGRENQPDNAMAFWRCTRNQESFTCKQTGAWPRQQKKDEAVR